MKPRPDECENSVRNRSLWSRLGVEVCEIRNAREPRPKEAVQRFSFHTDPQRLSANRHGYHGDLNRRTFLLCPLALAAAAEKRNVLLVIARGWRGVATPWNSDPDIQAPRLEAFSKQAIVFPRAYSAYPHPQEGRAAIASGRYPHATGAGATLESALREAGYRSSQQVGASVDFIKATSDAPYFLSATIDPERFSSSRDAATLHLRDNVPKEIAEKTRDALVARYAAYASMDAQFGKLLDSVGESTIVIFTSDAGEQIGSHELDGDDSFYEESVRVPLAIRFPGVQPGASDLLASTVDIMPTVLGLLGEPPVAGVQGRDLSWLITSGRGDRPESVFAEGRIGQRDEWRMLVLAMDKLVVDAAGDPTHLFNLARDPYEQRNLVHESSTELKRAQLLAIMRSERSRLLDFRRR